MATPETPRVSRLVTQDNHGLHRGDPVRFDGDNWVLAVAGDAGVGLVGSVKDRNTFEYVQSGYLDGLADFVPGQQYFVQDDGTLGTTETETPIFHAYTALAGFVGPSSSQAVEVPPDTTPEDTGGTVNNATFITVNNEGSLPNSRRLTQGSNITIDDAGPGGDITISATVPTISNVAPADAQYITLALNSDLTAERRFVPGTKLNATDSGANDDYTLNHADSALSAGTYYYLGGSYETDAQGHLIAALSDPFSNGEGRVFGRSSTARAITTGAFIYYSTDLDKFYIGTSAANGVLHTIDMIIKESYVLATYTTKPLLNAIYSATSGLLYLGYGATLTQSVNATTGAAVTVGIAAGITLGAAIRPSDGVIYGGNSGSGDLNRILSASDTTAAAIVLTKPLNNNSRKAVTYCDDNDSIYTLGGSGGTVGINRIDCPTNAEVATFTLAALSGGSGAGSCVWSAYAGKIYAVDGNVSALSQIDPSSDTQETSYAFPPGVAAGIGSNGIVCLGRYLYMGLHSASTPNEILVFDTLNNVFLGSLNTANGAVTDGRCMDGKAGAGIDDTFLLHGTSGVAATNWFIFGGRL